MMPGFPRRPRLLPILASLCLLPIAAKAGTMGLHFCEQWSHPQVSDGIADGFGTWTDSWKAPEGNFFGSGTSASLKGGGPVRVSWQSSNTNYAGAEGVNEQALYRSFLDDGDTGGGIGVQVSITNLSRWLALNEHLSYQIRTYCSTELDGATFQPITVRDGGATGPALETIAPQVLGDGDYPTGDFNTNNDPRGYGDSSNSLTADAITLTIPKRNVSVRGTLSSFKVTGIGTGPPVDHFESGDGTFSVVNAALGAGLISTFRAGLDSPKVTGSFSVGATHQIRVIQPAAGFTVQSYNLLTLPAGTSVNPSSFSLASLPAGVTGELEVNTSGANPIVRLKVTNVIVGFAGWIATAGVAPADQGMNADPDHDGLANCLEYVLGGNPAAGIDAAKLPSGQASGGNFVFSFDRAVSSETPDIDLNFQHGSDLSGWTTISVNTANPPTVAITRSGDNLTDHVVITIPASGSQQFGRLNAATTNP